MATISKLLYYSWAVNPFADFDFVSASRTVIKRRSPFMDVVKKTPYESFNISFNFSDLLLLSNETISSYTVTCINTATGLDSSATIINTDSNATPIINVLVQNGNDGESHKITVAATTNQGNIPELDCLLEIVAITSRDMFMKQPSERKILSNDFTNDIGADTINTYTVTATKISDGTDVTSSIIYNSTKATPKILLTAQAGADGELYGIAIKIVTTAGHKYQKDLLMNVRAI